MKLTFWGAAQTVTGSMHLLELDNGKKLLLDCGLYQGRRAEAEHINRNFPFDPASIDAILLSHAHIDHSGLLPRISKEGYQGPIYTTHATRDLCAYMLLDSAYIQERDAKFVNKRHRRQNKPPVSPLYTIPEAEAALEQFVALGYRQSFSPVPDVQVEYRDAGHILGSASMVLTIKENGKTVRLGFTGDVGRPNRLILRDPQPMADCDYLISESTYGGKTHDPPDLAKDRLAEVIAQTYKRKGKVLIPAFSLGRTQEIVHALDQLSNERRLPRIPVYVDSPLAVNVTSVYQAHPECYDEDLHRYLLTDDNPFGFEYLTYIRRVEQSKELNTKHEPMVIISASGMCEAGRILHHLRNNIQNPRNTVLMVGYCADHTLGKRIVERRPEVRIYGETFALRSDVVVMNSYSAHADEPALLSFIGHLDQQRLRKIFLVHGDLRRQEAFRDALRQKGYSNVEIPTRGHSVTL